MSQPTKDMEMSRSPRSAHLQMREERRQEQLHRAREKDRLKEMQAKLERHPLGKMDSLDGFSYGYGSKPFKTCKRLYLS